MDKPPDYSMYKHDEVYEGKRQEPHLLDTDYSSYLLDIVKEPWRIAYKCGILVQQSERLGGYTIYRVTLPTGDKRMIHCPDGTQAHALIEFLSEETHLTREQVEEKWAAVQLRRNNEQGSIEDLLISSPPPPLPFSFAQIEALKGCVLLNLARRRRDYDLLSKLHRWYDEIGIVPIYRRGVERRPDEKGMHWSVGTYLLLDEDFEALRTQTLYVRLPEPPQESYCHCTLPGPAKRKQCKESGCGCPCHINTNHAYSEMIESADHSPLTNFTATLKAHQAIMHEVEEKHETHTNSLLSWYQLWLSQGQSLAEEQERWRSEGAALLDQVRLACGPVPISFLLDL